METATEQGISLRQAVQQFIFAREGSFEDLALRVHFWQRRMCPPYAAYCATLPEPSSWREIPPLPISAFRQATISCVPPEEVMTTFQTSGTTGEGFGCHHFASLDLYRSAVLQGWKAAGLPSLPLYGLVPSPIEAPHSSLSCMAGWLIEPENFLWNNWEELERILKTLTTPCLLFGTALAFLDFFEKLGDRSLSLPEGCMALETGGYKGTGRSLSKEALYSLFEAKLGLASDKVWNEYGMTELSSQFYTRGLARPHTCGPWMRALVIDPATGEEVAIGGTGVLHIFDLANVDSCCALQTRDLAARSEEGFFLIGRDPSALPRGCSRAADEWLAR